MTKFIYVGPPSAITLGKKYESAEIVLSTGGEVSLPEGHPQVVRMLARGLLLKPELAVDGGADLPASKSRAPGSKPRSKSNASDNSNPENSSGE